MNIIELTPRVKRYIQLYKKYEDETGNDIESILDEMNELYYELDEDELSYLEAEQIC